MDRDNVTNIEAHKLADKIMAEWVAAYSDNGAIWQSAVDELENAKKAETQAIIEEALEIARGRWNRMYNVD